MKEEEEACFGRDETLVISGQKAKFPSSHIVNLQSQKLFASVSVSQGY